METAESYIGSNGTPGVIGLDALNRLRAEGYDDDLIQIMAMAENLTFGPKAKESLIENSTSFN